MGRTQRAIIHCWEAKEEKNKWEDWLNLSACLFVCCKCHTKCDFPLVDSERVYIPVSIL